MTAQPSFFEQDQYGHLSVYERQIVGVPYQPSSPTSIEAARSIAEHVTPMQARVLAYLAECGPSTQEEIAEGADMRLNSINPRINELAKAGKVVNTGETRATSSGRLAVVWRLPVGATGSVVPLESAPGKGSRVKQTN